MRRKHLRVEPGAPHRAGMRSLDRRAALRPDGIGFPIRSAKHRDSAVLEVAQGLDDARRQFDDPLLLTLGLIGKQDRAAADQINRRGPVIPSDLQRLALPGTGAAQPDQQRFQMV
jgi:hypothetical protein